jgi:hypothetical protein
MATAEKFVQPIPIFLFKNEQISMEMDIYRE